MSRSAAWRWLGLLLPLLATGARADEPVRIPTHREVQTLLVNEVTTELAARLHQLPWASRLRLHAVDQHELAPIVADSLAARLTQAGHEVWVAEGKASAADSLPTVELSLSKVEFALTAPERPFLSLSAGRVQRSATLVLDASIKPAQSAASATAWEAQPTAHSADWFPAGKRSWLAADAPPWILKELAAPPRAAARRSPWVERGLVAGLLGGVLILYVAGAS